MEKHEEYQFILLSNLFHILKVGKDGQINACQSRQYYSSVCQYNYKDLRNIEQSGRLFANKFNQNLDLVGIDCWEQWLNIKQTYHQDIDVKDYVDKYPFTRKL